MERIETILIMDFRYDEGVRPRKEMVCPCLMTRNGGGGGGINSSIPLLVEKWTGSESNKQQNKAI